MGDFDGHPFRGNQYTQGHSGAHVGGGSREGNLVQPGALASGGRGSRRLANIKAHVAGRIAEAKQGQHTKEEWLAIREVKLKEAEQHAARENEIKAQQDKLWAEKAAAVHAEHTAYNATQKACGDAYKDWQALTRDSRIHGQRGIVMPEANDAAGMRALTPEQRAAAEKYRVMQERTAETRDAYYLAQRKWDDANDSRTDVLARQRGEASGLKEEAARDATVALKAAQTYDRDVARAVQTADAEARDPRETPATGFSSLSPESLALVDAMNGTQMVNGKQLYMTTNAEGDKVYRIMDSSDTSTVSDGPRRWLPSVSDSEFKLTPGFKATIPDGKTFKKEMGKLFEGAVIEGLPRDADPHVLTIVHDEFRALRDEFPEVAVRHVKLNAGGARGVAWNGTDKITLGKEGVTNYTRAQMGFGAGKQRDNPDDTPDYHDGARSYGSVVRHEFAHQVHFQHPELFKEWSDAVDRLPPKDRARVTEYGRSDRYELFSESFAMSKYGDKGTKQNSVVKLTVQVTKNYFSRMRARRKP